MIRPSPNEFERLKNEEFNKRRLLRLKEVREHSKSNASRLRQLYQEQKSKVINKIAENIQEQLNSEDSKKILELQCKYDKQCAAIGDAHNNASDWIDPMISIQERTVANRFVAEERHEMALKQLKIDKEDRDFVKNSRLDALNLAMAIEKERAIAVASLPPPVDRFYNEELLKDIDDMTPRVRVCDRNKFSVIESYETFSYNVQCMADEQQRFEYGTNNAIDAGEIHQQQLSKRDNTVQMDGEEQSIKAQLRGHQAIKKQVVQKDYGELLINLEHMSKSEMAKRQREYHKNELVGPNSAGHLGIGHTVAMMGYKERCRERAVESAVMESLKDITNKPISSQLNTMIQGGHSRTETKLSKLYDIIRKQKENVTFEEKETQEEVKPDNVDMCDERLECVSPVTDNVPGNLDPVDDNIYRREVVKNATAAAIKSNSVLEKSSNEKERTIIERKIQTLDRRLELIKEADSISGNVTPRDYDRSIVSRSSGGDIRPTSSRSEELSVAPSSESVCSDSLNIIREFQRQALIKLSGHPLTQYSTHQLHSLERQLSEFSVESSSESETHRIDRLVGGSNTTLAASSESHSSVNEWVKTQLKQTIDRIPDWVTRTGTEPQFLPDLNMSFMSSILNIRSETSSTKDDSQSSCSTVMTHSSVLHHTTRSSITEISNIGNITDSSYLRVKNVAEEDGNEKSASVNNMSLNDLGKLSNNEIHVVDDGIMWENEQRDVNFQTETRSETIMLENEQRVDEANSCEDLINFQSVEDLTKEENVISEEENSYLMALNQLINIAAAPDFGSRDEIHDPESNSKACDLQNSELSSVISNRPVISPVTVTGIVDPEKSDNKLISDYESFLSGLINKTLVSQPNTGGTTLYSEPSTIKESLGGSSSEGNAEGKNDNEEQRLNTNGESKVSYFTSTTREDPNNPHLNVSLSPIQGLTERSVFDGQQFYQASAPCDNYTSSQGSMRELSPYSSDANDTVTTPRFVRRSEEPNGHGDAEQLDRKRIRQLLSSTMKPGKSNTRIPSPDISSISSISVEACNRLKQRVMLEYFEKNKNLFTTEISSTKSSDLSMKPLEPYEDSTPRNPDSGKPSSRATVDNSELNTARLTVDDYFMTPRSDNNNWTEFTPRDEWSSSHSHFQALSEYVSSGNGGESVVNDTMEKKDLDETLKNIDERPMNSECYNSINLIDFDSQDNFNVKDINIDEDRSNSQSFSDYSDCQFNNHKLEQDNIPSKESSSECNITSFQMLESYYSLSDSPTNPLNLKEISEFEDSHSLCIQPFSDQSVDSRSDADTSSVSLASFLRNESMCQETEIPCIQPSETSTLKRIPNVNSSLESSEEMKNQLARWKKERLTRINQHPLERTTDRSNCVIKTEIVRKKDDVEKKSRTLRLYNNLEEVQKQKQKKEVEQRKMENQLKKKEYAEKLRRLKKERNENLKR